MKGQCCSAKTEHDELIDAHQRSSSPPVPADYKPRSFGELLHAIDLVGSLLLAAGLSLSILG